MRNLLWLLLPSFALCACADDSSGGSSAPDGAGGVDSTQSASGQGSATDPCEAFVDNATATCTDDAILVASNGIPRHQTMVGIDAGGWNGQWVVEQPFTGNNVFRLPRNPVLAAEPTIAIRNGVGVAVNGIPLFLPQSPGKAGSPDCLDVEVPDGFLPDGECLRDPVAAGEMDDCGGHAGRGNDYHYHASPTCLMETLVDDAIVGFMLDGFPVYAASPEGSTPVADCGGFKAPDGSYHYRLTNEYPYITNCLIGEFDPENQADPLMAEVEPTPLPDADITGYFVDSDGCHNFEFGNGDTRKICP